jgi:Ca2+-binding RTX toxin-like protein
MKRLLAALALLLLMPATASAATNATVGNATDGGTLGKYLALASGAEANSVTVALGSGATLVSDPAGVTTTEGTCAIVTPTTLSCPVGPNDIFRADLGDGNDSLWVTANFKSVGVVAGGGNDVVVIDIDAKGDLFGGLGDDILAGGAAAEDFNGGPGRDWLIGRGGADRLSGSTGPDVIDGGAGADSVLYGDHSEPVQVILDDQANDGAAGEGDLVVAESAPNPAAGAGDAIGGGTGADFLVGDGGGNVISGGQGNDLVAGGAGDDTVNAQDGDDYAAGGAGNDRVIGGRGRDMVLGEAGNDRLHANAGSDDRDGAADVVSGGAGVDTYHGISSPSFCLLFPPNFCTATQPSLISLDDAANDNAEGDNVRADVESISRTDPDGLIVDAASDILVGNGADNVLESGNGDDRLAPGGGKDIALAGSGNDLIDTRDGVVDLVDCGLGTDFLRADPLDLHDGCETVELPSGAAAARSAS